MGKVSLKYVNAYQSKGRLYHYFRHGHFKARLPGEPGSLEFMARYTELLALAQPKASPATLTYAYGSIDWLIADYRANPKFTRLAPKTKVSYGHMLDFFKPIGRFSVSRVERAHIQALRKQFLNRPRTADEFAKVTSIIFAHAVDLGLIERNPAAGIAKVNRSEPYRAWTDEECAAFEAACRPGPLLTAYMLGLHTGQRKGDILKMTWAQYDGSSIAVRQHKTGRPLKIAAHTKLRLYLEIVRRETLLMLPTANGTAWDESAFSKAFRKALDAAGLPRDVHFHGLRKTAAKRLADAGCSVHEIQSVTGQKSLAMIAHYTDEANQVDLAKSAVSKLEKPKAIS